MPKVLPLPEGFTLEEFKSLDPHKQWAIRHPVEHKLKESSRRKTDTYKKQKAENKKKNALLDIDKFVNNRWEKYLGWQYNITAEKYWNIFNEQHGLCAMCLKPETVIRTLKVYGIVTTTKRLCVDHDHSCCRGAKSCGKCIRGLLCHHCNTTLGSARDNIQTLQNGINYLLKRGNL